MARLFSYDNPFWQLVNKALQLFLLNLLWLFFSLPVVTMGASTAALYSMTHKMVRNQEGYLFSGFLHGFRTNWKQATVIWLILLAAGIFLGVDLSVYLNQTSTGPVSFILMTAFFAVLVLYAMELLYVFAVLARFENTVVRTMGAALLIAIRNLPRTILMIAADVLLLAAGFLIFPPILFLGMALIAYVNSWFLIRIFTGLGDLEEEDVEKSAPDGYGEN